jgi:hypothetical protein
VHAVAAVVAVAQVVHGKVLLRTTPLEGRHVFLSHNTTHIVSIFYKKVYFIVIS